LNRATLPILAQLEDKPSGLAREVIHTWAALMRRIVDLDVLACRRRGDRLRVIATM
jgi:hypothetical protein